MHGSNISQLDDYSNSVKSLACQNLLFDLLRDRQVERLHRTTAICHGCHQAPTRVLEMFGGVSRVAPRAAVVVAGLFFLTLSIDEGRCGEWQAPAVSAMQ